MQLHEHGDGEGVILVVSDIWYLRKQTALMYLF